MVMKYLERNPAALGPIRAAMKADQSAATETAPPDCTCARREKRPGAPHEAHCIYAGHLAETGPQGAPHSYAIGAGGGDDGCSACGAGQHEPCKADCSAREVGVMVDREVWVLEREDGSPACVQVHKANADRVARMTGERVVRYIPAHPVLPQDYCDPHELHPCQPIKQEP